MGKERGPRREVDPFQDVGAPEQQLMPDSLRKRFVPRGRHTIQHADGIGRHDLFGHSIGKALVKPRPQQVKQLRVGHGFADGEIRCDDEILQVEGLEIGDVLRAALVKGLLGQARQSAGRGGYLDQLRVGQHAGALARPASEDHEGPIPAAEGGEALRIDDLGRNLAPGNTRGVEDLCVDLHAPGVDHRAEPGALPVVDRDDARLVVLAGHLGQGVERPHGDQRLAQSVAEPLGERHADAQPGIGSGALAHGHGVELVGRNARFAQQLVDEHRDLAGVVAPLVALAQRQQLTLLGNSDGADVRAGFNTENQ